MAILTSDGKVVSSGPGWDGTLRSWQLFQRWLAQDMPNQRAAVRAVRRGQ